MDGDFLVLGMIPEKIHVLLGYKVSKRCTKLASLCLNIHPQPTFLFNV